MPALDGGGAAGQEHMSARWLKVTARSLISHLSLYLYICEF